MDLATLDTEQRANAGVEVQLKHPTTGAPLEMWITLYGMDSQAYEDKQLEMQRRRLELMSRGSGGDPDPARRVAQEKIEMLVAFTKDWRGIERDGQTLAYSQQAATALYSKRGLRWIGEQIDTAVHDRALFLPGGAND